MNEYMRTIISGIQAWANSVFAKKNDFHKVAKTGKYSDLSGIPKIPEFPDLADVAYTGDYNDLGNKPTLFSGDYNDLDNLPTGVPDVVAYNYVCRIGKQNSGIPGFGISANNGDKPTTYGYGKIKDETTGGYFDMRGQSILRATSTDKRNITINVTRDGASGYPGIIFTDDDGSYLSLKANGEVWPSKHILKVGYETGDFRTIIRGVKTPENSSDAATKEYVDGKISDTEVILNSSTAGSTKKFRITVDDNGTIVATEVT